MSLAFDQYLRAESCIEFIKYELGSIVNIMSYNIGLEWSGIQENIPKISMVTTYVTPPPTSTRNCLMILYDMLGGDDWYDNTNWGGSEPCSYFGITCNGGGNVITIALDSNNLMGSFNDSFAWPNNLNTLTQVNLRGNDITGRVPSQFGRLINVHWMNLESNSFSGTIKSKAAFPITIIY